MATEAQKAANRRYDASHTRGVYLKLNLKTDADVIARLEREENVQGYIKRLIRQDIAEK